MRGVCHTRTAPLNVNVIVSETPFAVLCGFSSGFSSAENWNFYIVDLWSSVSGLPAQRACLARVAGASQRLCLAAELACHAMSDLGLCASSLQRLANMAAAGRAGYRNQCHCRRRGGPLPPLCHLCCLGRGGSSHIRLLPGDVLVCWQVVLGSSCDHTSSHEARCLALQVLPNGCIVRARVPSACARHAAPCGRPPTACFCHPTFMSVVLHRTHCHFDAALPAKQPRHHAHSSVNPFRTRIIDTDRCDCRLHCNQKWFKD